MEREKECDVHAVLCLGHTEASLVIIFPDNSLQIFHYTDLIKFNGFDSVLTLWTLVYTFLSSKIPFSVILYYNYTLTVLFGLFNIVKV